jgi:TPR repeat protein
MSLMIWLTQAQAADLNELQRLAAQRDPLAQYQLAQLYQQGSEVEPSPQKAQYWLEQASELGNVAAQSELIELYLADTSNLNNLKEALYWLSLQAASGIELSQTKLGDYYSNYGDQIDAMNQAIVWYRIASTHSKDAELKYNALLQAQFDGKRLKRVQQLEQLSGVLDSTSSTNNASISDSVEYNMGVIQTDVVSIIVLSVLTALIVFLTIKRRKQRATFTNQQSQKQHHLTQQLKISQRTIDKQKQQLSSIVKQYKKLQQLNEKKPSSNQQQLVNAYTLFGCEANLIPDEKTLKLRYRQLSKVYHPDAGGNSSAMAQLNHSLKLLIALGKAQQARKTSTP